MTPETWLVDIGRLVRVLAPNGRDALSLATLDAGAVTSGPVCYRLQEETILEVLDVRADDYTAS